jgi:hypothetical protein
MSSNAFKAALLAALFATRLVSTSFAAQAPAEKPAATEKEKAPIERMTAWPKPADKSTLMTDIERLVKSRTPEMGEQAHDALKACGASAVPFVLERYGKERDKDAAERLHDLLLEITDGTQTRLLAKHFTSKSPAERTFALWRTAAFPDPELAGPANAAFEAVKKQGEKADADERYAAALCCASAGSSQGMEFLWPAAVKDWDTRGVEIRTAIEPLRGAEATKWVIEKSNGAGFKEKVAVLRLLAGCGDKSSISHVRPFLDDSDNTLRVAAVNALRGIVDGDPPLEQLPVFEVIEMAKQWKLKLI